MSGAGGAWSPHSPKRPPRNPGMALDLGWVTGATVDTESVQSRAARIANRSPLGQERETELYLQALSCTDLTTLSGDDTPQRVRQLCSTAREPLRPDVAETLGLHTAANRTASVCVYHRFIGDALEALEGSAIPVCAVSAGFPHGLSPLAQRVEEVRASVEEGAMEIDVVIMRAHALTGDWAALYEELSAFRAACGNALLKTILATGELGTLSNVARASRVAMMAGTDFIKTSTGKENINATLPAGLVMSDAIRDYRDRTGFLIGLKPAGGIRTAAQALDWLTLAGDELGSEWTEPALFRFGASSLLDDLRARLEPPAES